MTDRQNRFVEEYLVDLNAAAAARRAGYADGNAARLMGNPALRQAIREAQQARAESCRVRQEQVLQELKAIAFAEASDAAGARLKPASKLKALELLGRHLGMFEGRPRQEQQVVIVEDI